MDSHTRIRNIAPKRLYLAPSTPRMMRRLATAAALAAVLLGGAVRPASAQAPAAALQAEVPVTVTVPQPNPVRSSSRFQVTARRDVTVRVELLNLLGQRVASLYDGRLGAGESQTVTINVGDLPMGLYLYRVQADRSVVTRQVYISR